MPLVRAPRVSAMYARAFVLGSLFLGLARANNASDLCAQEYEYSHNITRVNITKVCKEKPCITKCCSADTIFLQKDNNSTNCINLTYLENKYKFKANYSLIEIFNKDIKKRDAILTKKKVYSDFVILFNNFFFEPECYTDYKPTFRDSERWYILEDGTFECRAFNHVNQWFSSYKTGEFCFELLIEVNEGKLLSKNPETVIYLKKRNEPPAKKTKEIKNLELKTYGLLVSCVFMVLVLLVYALLPELRNLMGLMLMSYLVANIAYFLLRVIHVFTNEHHLLSTNMCSVISLLFYYAMLSSFAWLNVMSFDIWWTLRRGMPVGTQGRLSRKGRRLVPKKFLRYSLHGWGTPLIPTVFVIVVDLVDLRKVPYFIKPHIIKGNFCWFADDEYWRYVTIPLMVLVLTSLVLFVMTVIRIWLVRRNVKAIGTTSKTTEFKTYVTISLVMGATWIFEVLSAVIAPNSVWWYIPDFYNLFVGFILFLVFVCKKKVFLSLCNKFSIDNAFIRKLRASEPQSSFATDHRRGTHSTVCATASLDVNAHPAGVCEKKP